MHIHYRYLVIPEFLSQDEVHALLNRSKQLLEDFSLDGHPLVRIANLIYVLRGISLDWQTTFTTEDDGNPDKKHVGDEYFLSSGGSFSLSTDFK